MWYGNNIWQRLQSLSVYTASAVASKDITWVLPDFWDSFWDAIDDDGEELRVVTPWGTLADWKVTNHTGSGSFSKANRHGAIHVRAGTLPNVAASISQYLLFYKSASVQGPSSTVVSFTPSAPLTGDLCLAGPGIYQAAYTPPLLRQRKPPITWVKRSADVLRVGVAYTPNLARASYDVLNGGSMFETPYYATLDSLNTAGSSDNRFDASKTFWHFDGTQFWLITEVQGGTDQTYYTLIPQCHTVAPPSGNIAQSFTATIGLRVEDSRHE